MSTNIKLMGSLNRGTCRTVHTHTLTHTHTYTHEHTYYIRIYSKKKIPFVLVKIKIPQYCDWKKTFFFCCRIKYINMSDTNWNTTSKLKSIMYNIRFRIKNASQMRCINLGFLFIYRVDVYWKPFFYIII